MTTTDAARARAAAAGLVGLEGLAATVAGVVFVIAALLGEPANRSDAIVLGVLLLLAGVGVLAVARGLLRGSNWARTPAFLVQFFGLVVAYNQHDTLPAVSVVLGVVCVAAAVALVASQRRTPV